MAVRIFRKDMLISALIVAIAIFLIGFYLGDKLDSFRVDDATKLLMKNQIDSESFDAQNKFFSTFSKNECLFNKDKLSTLGKQLAEMGQTLLRYDIKKLTHLDSYNDLKRKYFITELEFYTMKKNLDIKCGNNNPVILFFYNTKDNEESLKQGYALDVIGRDFKDLVVLSFDKDFDEDAVKVLNNFYKIENAPTIILNYNKKYDKFITEGELRAILNEKKSN